MSLARRLIACLLAVAALPALAQSAPLPVDDSASTVLAPGEIRMRWESLVPDGNDRIIGQFAVVVRLDVSAWQGRQARIYKRLPPQAGAPVTARWRSSRGVLLEGAVRDGERTLVYSGPITTPRIEDTLTVVLEADGGRATRAQTLDFGFEIELEPAP